MSTLNVLSLFAGIGGLDLGLERAGMTVVGQVEISRFCRSILERHWPDVPRSRDVRYAAEWWQSEPRPAVDVVCGGPPCQPFSKIGQQLGTGDPRWAWPWFAQVVEAVRPRYVLLENVPGLLLDSAAFGWIVDDLSRLGFDSEWSPVSACALGAPYTRRRLFVVANANGQHGRKGVGISGVLSSAGGQRGARAGEGGDPRARTWRDSVDRSLAASRADGREANGLARWMVSAGGNAVVPAVAEFVGRLIVDADRGRAAA